MAIQKIKIEKSDTVYISFPISIIFSNYLKEGVRINYNTSFSFYFQKFLNIRFNVLYPRIHQISCDANYVYIKFILQHMDDTSIVNLLNEIFKLEDMNDTDFDSLKDSVIKDFRVDYRQIKVKTFLNILEITNSKKNFSFNKLVNDILYMNKEDFLFIYKNFINESQSLISILSKEVDEIFIEKQFVKKEKLIPLVEIQNENQIKLKKIIPGSVSGTMRCVCFNFLNPLINYENKILILKFIGAINFKNIVSVNVDEIESSILFWDDFDNKEIKQYFLKDEFLSAKNRIIQELDIVHNEENFIKESSEFWFNNSFFYSFLERLEKMDVQSLNELIEYSEFHVNDYGKIIVE